MNVNVPKSGLSEYTLDTAANFDNARTLQNEVAVFIDHSENKIRIQFSDKTRSNSLTVALMMSWYRSAELADKSILFSGLPPGIKKIVEISGLSNTLPIED